MKYAFRLATPDDAKAIMAVHRRSILELGRANYSRAETESWAAGLKPEGYVRGMTERGDAFRLALDAGGEIAGFCSVRGDEIMALFIDPRQIRRGIATMLADWAETEIANAGHEVVRVKAALSGVAFYLSRGYLEVAEHLWETKGGLVLKTMAMEKPG